MERRAGFTLIELLIVIAIISILASLTIVAVLNAIRSARTASAQTRIGQCSLAATAYELDHAAYPPGDGAGSALFYQAVSGPGPREKPYFHLQPAQLINGSIANPAMADEILHYRRNNPNPPADAKNPFTFDMWGTDAWGVEKGVNNWSQ